MSLTLGSNKAMLHEIQNDMLNTLYLNIYITKSGALHSVYFVDALAETKILKYILGLTLLNDNFQKSSDSILTS